MVQCWYLWVECDIWNIARVIKTFSTMAPMWYFSSWMPILSLFWFSWRRLASFSHKKLFWNIWCHSSTFPISKLSYYIWLINFLKLPEHCHHLIFVLNSFLYFCWLPFIFVLINFSKLPEHCRHLRGGNLQLLSFGVFSLDPQFKRYLFIKRCWNYESQSIENFIWPCAKLNADPNLRLKNMGMKING